MAGGEDPQQLKNAMAAAYDYDNDPRWPEYWSNVLIPPHMASNPDVVYHFKRKFYQRYIDPDLFVEPMTTGSSFQQAQSSYSQASYSSSSTSQPWTHNPGRTYGTTPTRNPTLRWDRQTILFSVNAWVLAVAALAIFPLVYTNLSKRAYRLSLMGTACSSMYSSYMLYGKPRAWNLQALQVWFQSVVMTRDFIYFIYCLTFVSSNLHLKFAVIPIICRSLEHVAKFLRHNFSQSSLYRRYLENTCVWVESNRTTLAIVSSQAEIGLGFLLIISIFSWHRNVIHTFMYWQLLKVMYHAPATGGYHKRLWTMIGRFLNPHVQRHAPFLNAPFYAIRRWWFR